MISKINYPKIPLEWDRLTGYSVNCPCGRTHAIDTRQVVIGAGVVEETAQIVLQFSSGQAVGLVADETTYAVAGRIIHEQLAKQGVAVTLCIVAAGAGGRPHATFETVLDVQHRLRSTRFIVAVGSGTINDLGKLASYRLGISYMVVATAPSMNGYTSAIAAIMKDGLKQTVDCHQPVSVVADLNILSDAPLHLIQAGLGDLESKPVSTADFLLSSLIRQTYYCPVPGSVVQVAEARAAACADGLVSRQPDAVKVLTEALLLSGFSMKLAGSSSPASGGEHLVSHYWDMTAADEGRVEGFHGAQVGVATMAMAFLYEYLQKLSPGLIDVERLLMERKSAEEEAVEVVARHGAFGELAKAEMAMKRLDDNAYRQELEFVVQNWRDIWNHLPSLSPAARIRSVLESAGCPVSVEELGLSKSHLHRGLLHAREIRGRFTVLDFAADLGVLESAADYVLAEFDGLMI